MNSHTANSKLLSKELILFPKYVEINIELQIRKIVGN